MKPKSKWKFTEGRATALIKRNLKTKPPKDHPFRGFGIAMVLAKGHPNSEELRIQRIAEAKKRAEQFANERPKDM